MKDILIFGHQNPDTDSVLSAINLATLKNKLGQKAVPKVLGDINFETKFVLDYFDIPIPKFLNDVKLQISDIDYQKNNYLKEKTTVLHAFDFFRNNNNHSLPIVNNNLKLKKIIHITDIANYAICDADQHLITSYDNILDCLKGLSVTKFASEIDGDVLVAAYDSKTFKESVKIKKNSILIVGNRPDIQEYAILNKAQLIILTGNYSLSPKLLKLAKEKKVNVIVSKHDTYKTSRLVMLSHYINRLNTKNPKITFRESDYVEEFKRTAKNNPYHEYPVVDNNNHVLGVISLLDLEKKHPKKVILVDHNESRQSVIGLEEAEILEIIDHHKIGNLATSYPISFRNMIVGSTNTIIYFLFQENNIPIDKTTAGLIMAGIISDTLMLKSPTTTEIDHEVLEKTSKIAEIDTQDFAKKMFEAGSEVTSLSKEELLYNDFKSFNIKKRSIGIGQLKTTNPTDIKKDLSSFSKLIETEAKNKDYYILALFVTDIINNGSYIIFNKKAKAILEDAFTIKNLENWTFIPESVSRKQQIIPRIIDVIEKSS